MSSIASGKAHRGAEVSVAIPSGARLSSVTVATAEVKDVSALWGLALVELAAPPPRDATFGKVAARAVPIQLGEWLTRPAGLDAVEIVAPADLPLGTWVVDEKRRFVGIVSRLAHRPGLVLIRPRTLNLFASAEVSGNVAPVVPAMPLALIVDEPRVRERVAKLDTERQSRQTAPAAGPQEFALEPPSVREDAAALLRTGGLVVGDPQAARTLVVVLPSTGRALATLLDHVAHALEAADSLRTVLHVLPTAPSTPASRDILARACALAENEVNTWAGIRTAIGLPTAEAPRCASEAAESFWQAEADLLARAQVDQPVMFIDETVLAPQEPAPVIRAALGIDPKTD